MAVVRIQDLATAPAPLTGTEVVEIEQGGVSYKTTAQDIADLGGGGGGAVPVQEEGSTVVATPTAINFVGAGVTATDVGGVATVTIPGGGGSSAVQSVTGTTYTVAAADDQKFLRFTNTSAKSATFDPDSVTALPADGEWIFSNDAATGDLTLTPGSGVTLTPPAGGSLVIPPRGVAAAKRVAVDVFVIFGSTNP